MKVTDKKNINELLDMIEMSVHRKMKTSPVWTTHKRACLAIIVSFQ